MDRQEVIRLLTQLREAGEEGSPRWSKLMDDIRELGPIHDPEFIRCKECGTEYEHTPIHGQGRPLLPRCFNCRFK